DCAAMPGPYNAAMGLDTLICLIIAVVIFARLWSVLGRRNENDVPRPNPFAPRPREEDAAFSPESVKADRALPIFKPINLAPASLAGSLQSIKDIDPAFDEKTFLQDAKQNFITIIEDFSKGELSQLTKLLGPHVLVQFQSAIEARRNAGETAETKIVVIKDAETTSAKLDGTKATIAVRFVSEQENTLRDASGSVIGGGPGKLEEITDVWSFSRDLKSSDPTWVLSETHG
ncbi:MAG TPA: Tim44/TimA family putative adaptor protein, partial [Alphaproteobacteria bacterium]|nr:Tim44/TimA family putative adaptor protein [Alphaproteobacteria bacterium]